MALTKILSSFISDATAAGIALLTASNLAAQKTILGIVPTYPNTTAQGRLTLVTNTPVLTTSQTAKTAIFYTPYNGDTISLYDGTNIIATTFAELTVATTDTAKNPAAIGASKVNDWFVWSDAGTLRISHGPDWTDDVTRSAGTALTKVKGITLNSVSITNGPAASRGTYVGTTRSNASSQLEFILGGTASGGTAAALHVWNMYNRRAVVGQPIDSAAHTYATATIRQFGGSAGNQVSFITGLQEEPVTWSFKNEMSMTAVAGSRGIVGVGFDTTTAFSSPRTGLRNPVAVAYDYSGIGTGVWLPTVGRHVISFNEQGDGTNANEFNNSLSAALNVTVNM